MASAHTKIKETQHHIGIRPSSIRFVAASHQDSISHWAHELIRVISHWAHELIRVITLQSHELIRVISHWAHEKIKNLTNDKGHE